MPTNTVKVDRATRFGNPFLQSQYGRDRAMAMFRAWIMGSGCPVSMPQDACIGLSRRRRELMRALPSLRGKNLACWCPLPEAGEPDQCHAAVLLELANL